MRLIKIMSVTLLLLGSSRMAKAQSTNFTVVVRVVVDGVTNNASLLASSNVVSGAVLAHLQYQQNGGKSGFAQFVQEEFAGKMQNYANDFARLQMAQSRVGERTARIGATWPTMSPEDQAALVAILQKYQP